MSTQNLPLRTRIATQAGIVTAALSKRLGRGEGSVIGGRVSLVIDPNSLERLAAGRLVALVSGTNGKTTTTSLLASAMETRGDVVTNMAGANMFGGMVSALSGSAADVAVLEVDEGHLPQVLKTTNPRVVVLLNLSRDQLDRVGEVRMQAQKWREALAHSPTVVVANADDPLIVWAASSSPTPIWVAAGGSWTMDAASCPACGARILWDASQWSCSGCELSRPQPHAFFGTAPKARSTDIAVRLETKLPGQINRNNAAIALMAAVVMGSDPAEAAKAIAASEGAGGRFSSVEIGGAKARLILAKNPAGWSEALRIVRPAPAPLVTAINARVQDGRDPSWLWDVPYEQLQGQFVVATGERGRDLAVRLRYANVEHVYEGNLTRAVAIASQRSNGEEVDVIGNYSAFQDFRKLSS